MKRCCKKFLKENHKVLSFLCKNETNKMPKFYPEDYEYCGYCGEELIFISSKKSRDKNCRICGNTTICKECQEIIMNYLCLFYLGTKLGRK